MLLKTDSVVKTIGYSHIRKKAGSKQVLIYFEINLDTMPMLNYHKKYGPIIYFAQCQRTY